MSVVTPSLDQARFLEDAIRSVLEQDYPAVEYLVVDGGSTDGSVEIIRRYEDRLSWWTSEPDRGQADALNRGLARARGEYLTWLSSDDALLPGALSELAGELERDPGLVLVYGDALFVDEEGRETGYLPSREPDWAQMVCAYDCHVVQPASLFRRSAWEAAGPLREAHYFFDFELFVRMSALGRAKRIPKPLAAYRLHGGSKSVGAPAERARAYVEVADGLLDGSGLPEALRPYARQGRSRAYLRAGDELYWALDLPAARRCLARGLALYPLNASPRYLALAAKSLLPRPAVERLRARRHRER